MIDLRHASVEDWAASYTGEPFHALLCDPPYELGFMNRKWDSTGVAFRPETWAALARHLYPGAFGFAFCDAARGHRMACAIEDAGMVMHPKIFCYVHGQGFPKATRMPDERFIGHRYGRQALKPAVEQIICFQAPYKGKSLDSITQTGAGALNIEAGRVGTNKRMPGSLPGPEHNASSWSKPISRSTDTGQNPNIGRWPANFVTVGEEAAAALDRQSGSSADRPAKYALRGEGVGYFGNAGGVIQGFGGSGRVGYQTQGGASRYFFHAVEDALDAADPVRYCAKAGRSERDEGLDEFAVEGTSLNFGGSLNGNGKPINIGARANTHPTVKPISLCKWLALLLLPPVDYAPRRILVPFAGSGSETIAAHLGGWEEIVGIERDEEYIRIARARAKHWQKKKGAAP